MKHEFDFQWRNLPCEATEYSDARVKEFQRFTGLGRKHIEGKCCLDAGCGNGRYTYAMQQLGARSVTSFDESLEAVRKCREANPEAFVESIFELDNEPLFDFVLSYGVIHHTHDPYTAFCKLVDVVKPEGRLHIMVYNAGTQGFYTDKRELWKHLNQKERLGVCKSLVRKHGGHLHGWYDALNPRYNYSFTEQQVKKMFVAQGFKNIRVIRSLRKRILGLPESINVNGVKK